jgi:hypothetical protein
MDNLSVSKGKLNKTLFLAGAACCLLFNRAPAAAPALPPPPSTLEPTTVEELDEINMYFNAWGNFYVGVSNPLRITLLKAAGLPADNRPHPGEVELLQSFYPNTFAAAKQAAHALLGPPTANDGDGDKSETDCWDKDTSNLSVGQKTAQAILDFLALGDGFTRTELTKDCLTNVKDPTTGSNYTEAQCHDIVDEAMREEYAEKERLQDVPIYPSPLGGPQHQLEEIRAGLSKLQRLIDDYTHTRRYGCEHDKELKKLQEEAALRRARNRDHPGKGTHKGDGKGQPGACGPAKITPGTPTSGNTLDGGPIPAAPIGDGGTATAEDPCKTANGG